MKDYQELKEEAKQYIRYDKDKANKIAYLTFARPEAQNATTAGMRQLYADLIHGANTDDDVKVLVIRGEGEHFGSGGDLPEQADMLSESDEDVDLRWEIGINDPDVKYPPRSPTASCTISRITTPRPGPVAGRCRSSRRSALSRPRVTVTAGTSTRRGTRTWWCPQTRPCSATRPSATWAGARACGPGSR